MVLCSDAKDCWLSLELPAVDWWGETVERRPHKERPFPLGFLGVMRFCGSGALLAGPWALQTQINIRQDSRIRELPAGVYEICYCSPVRVGDTAVSCVEGKEFRFLRALLQLSSGNRRRSAFPSNREGTTMNSTLALPSISLRPLAGAAAAATSDVWLEATTNEIGPEFVFCRVGTQRRTDSSCRFTLRSAAATERPVALSIAPVAQETGDSAGLCTQPGITMAVSVKGEAEVELPSFLPTSLKYAICGNGSLLGTLITSGELTLSPSTAAAANSGVSLNSLVPQSCMRMRVGALCCWCWLQRGLHVGSSRCLVG